MQQYQDGYQSVYQEISSSVDPPVQSRDLSDLYPPHPQFEQSHLHCLHTILSID